MISFIAYSSLFGAVFAAVKAAVFSKRHTPLDVLLERIRWPKRTPKTPPRAHGGTGEPPRPAQGMATGARRTNIIDRALARLLPATGCHTPEAVRLLPDLTGKLHSRDTGSFAVPPEYLEELRRGNERMARLT